MTLWHQCSGEQQIISFNTMSWRVVEAQHFSSSRNLVDTPEEHEILEDLIEGSKPPVDEMETHYLIFTPFRYPPLQYGSRFGKRIEPSLWYGSLEMETAFCETAYYRLLFFWDTEADLGYIDIPLTVFCARIKTSKGIELNKIPFEKFRSEISAKSNYQYSQELGTCMRDAGIEAFTYYSARSMNNGLNIGVFTPHVFQKKGNSYIHKLQNWRCVANKNYVEFFLSDLGIEKKFVFNVEVFEENGTLFKTSEWLA